MKGKKQSGEPLENWKVSAATMYKVRVQCAVDKLSQGELAEQALAAYLGHGSAHVSTPISPPGDPDPAHAKYHQMLAEILNSGVREYIFALIMNLVGWSRATRDRLGYPDDEAHAIPDPTGLVAELDRLTRASKAIREGKLPEAKRKRA